MILGYLLVGMVDSFDFGLLGSVSVKKAYDAMQRVVVLVETARHVEGLSYCLPDS